MAEFSSIFEELLNEIKNIKQRISKFETWEPVTGFVDTGAHAYKTVDKSILSGFYTTVDFNTTLWDTDSFHSGGTMTIPTDGDGKYFFQTVLWFTATTGTINVRINKSATDVITTNFNGIAFNGVQLSGIIQCVAGDTIIVDVNPTVNVVLLGSASIPYQSFFQVQRVG